MNHVDLIDQSERLVKAMGYWPSFHDANVLSLLRTKDSCTATIHVFEMTRDVDSNGYFVLRNHHLVKLSMLGIRSNSLPERYTGDILSRLSVIRDTGLIRVEFESHMDNDGSVLCEHVRVVSVEACDGNGNACN
jgi:hypothetical protein